MTEGDTQELMARRDSWKISFGPPSREFYKPQCYELLKVIKLLHYTTFTVRYYESMERSPRTGWSTYMWISDGHETKSQAKQTIKLFLASKFYF